MATVNVSNSLVHSTGAYCLSAGSGGSHMLVHTDYVCIPTLHTSSSSFSDLTVTGNLTVQGTTTTLNTTVTSTSAMCITNSGTGPALQLNQTGTQPVVDFQDDGSSAFYIEDGGYVGIGSNNPGSILQIKGDCTLFGSTITVRECTGTTDRFYGGLDANEHGYVSLLGNDNTNRVYLHGGSGTDNYILNNVGIGKTAPDYELDVVGCSRASARVYIGTGGGYFYNDASSRVRINQDFYTNNGNTYLYGNNTYLGAGSGDLIHTRDNQFRTRCIRAYNTCGLQFFDDSGTEYMRLWDGGTVSTGTATAGAFQLQNGDLSKNFYDNHPGAYFHAPSMIIRKDDSNTPTLSGQATLVLYNNNGTCGTGTKLVFASRETAGAGNPVATAAIISRNVGGCAGSWACGDLAIMTKNRCTYCSAMCFDRLGISYFQQDCTYWCGSNTYLRSANEFSFLDGSAAQNARFKGIQVSNNYSGTVPTCGILFGADTCLLRSASGQLEISSTANSTLLNIRSKNAGCAMVRAGLSTDGTQATGAFEVTQDGSYGGGISYNGDASPAFASGETADNVTFYNLNAGTRTEVFHYAYNSTTVNFNATPTVGGSSVWHAGNDGSGSGLDADTVDGTHASGFLLCTGMPNNTDTWLNFRVIRNANSSTPANDGMYIGYSNSNSGITRLYGGGSNCNYSYISGDGCLYHDDGSKYWNAGNDGSGSGLDADLLDGYQQTCFVRLASSSSSATNGNFAIGNASSRNFIQSHNSQPLDLNPLGNTVTIGGTSNTAWHAGNDGASSGLDADLLDGNHGTHYLCRVASQSFNSTSCNLNCISSNQGWYNWSSQPPANNPSTYGVLLHICDASQAQQLVQTYGGAANKVRLFGRRKTNGNWDTSWTEYWSNTNDGSGSGLDADCLDGLHASSFVRSDADDTVSKQVTFPSAVGDRPILQGGFLSRLCNDGDADIWGISETFYPSANSTSNAWGIRWSSSPNEIQFVGANANKLRIDLDTAGKVYIDNNEVWHAGNDGCGSGLNADTVDNLHGTQFLRQDVSTTKVGNLNFTSNNACLTLCNYGRIGIGMTDPQHPLEICLGDNSTFTTGIVFVQNSGNRGTRCHASGSALFQYCFSDQPGMILNKCGYVGIGCNNPGSILQIKGDGSLFGSTITVRESTGTTDRFYGGLDANQHGYVSLVGNDNTNRVYLHGGNGTDNYILNNVGIGTTDPGSCKLHVVGGSTLAGTVNLVNNSLSNVGHITINDPGVGEGLAWNSTSGNWIIDVAPLGRTNADGNLNFYNSSSNNIALWRPQLWVYSASCYATGTANSDGSLTITSTNTGADIFSVEGSNGTLFSVADDLSDSLMSVNDAAGLPVLEVFADNSVCAGRFGCSDFYIASGGNIGIHTNSPDANHDLTIANNANYGIRFTGTNSTIQANANLIETAGNMIYLRAGSSYCTMIDTGCGLAISSGCLNMCNMDIHYVDELHFNDNIRFCGTGDSNKIRLCSGCADSVKLELGTQTTYRGSLYANSGNCVGILDQGGDWAIIHKNDAFTAFRDSGGTERLCIGTTQIKSNEPFCIAANWNYGTEPEQLTIQGTYPSLALRSTNAGTGNTNLLHVNDSGHLDFYSTACNSGAASDSWAKRACVATNGMLWAQNCIRVNSSGYLRQVTGNYGSIEVDGGATGGWEGYSIEGRAVFMHDSSCTTGIYNDVNNEWLFCAAHNGSTALLYNGSKTFYTISTGVCISQLGDPGIQITGGSNEKINMSGATNPYIRFEEGTTDKAYIQWHGDNGEFKICNQEDSRGIIINTDLCFYNGTGNCTVWHAGNDGSGSGLDADKLDGVHGSSFVRSDTADNLNGQLTMATQKALIASNYGHGVYGLYHASKYQHVWSMGTSYNVCADGSGAGNLYGLAWSHTNAGGQTKSGLSHQLLLMMNGVTCTALGAGIWTKGSFTSNDSGGNYDFRVEAQSGSTGPLGNKAYAIFVDASAGAVGIGTSQPSYALEVNGTAFVTGTFSAGTKNFLIDHPTRENYMLRHGSLEGPENAVYVRGTTTSSSIELPEYWTGLVDEDSITATLTPRGKYLQLFLDRVEDNELHVGGTEVGELYDYVVYGTRKDVEEIVVEFERPVGS